MSPVQPFASLTELALAEKPRLAIVIGSGLSPVASQVRVLHSVSFSQIPGMSQPSVPGHKGRLTLGNWVGKRVLVFEGRLHFYEGHSWDAVTRPIRLAHSLGARILLATNAAGGIHSGLHPGSYMAIRHHLDWTGSSYRRPGSPSEQSLQHSEHPESNLISTSPYSPRLLDFIQKSAANLNLELLTGTYAAVTGPNYETPAEIRALRACGADAVGMSTIREIQFAHDLRMECAALSCITNRAAGLDEEAPITHDEVLRIAKASSQQLTRLVESFIEKVA